MELVVRLSKFSLPLRARLDVHTVKVIVQEMGLGLDTGIEKGRNLSHLRNSICFMFMR